MDRYLALEAFVRVAESGGFTRAAQSLGISTPAVSERVKQLELLVGQPLLYRTTRSVSLTEAGIDLLPGYADLVRRMGDLESAPGPAAASLTGRLRVASVIDFGMSHIAPTLSALARTFPALVVELNLDNRLINPIADGFDVAIHFRTVPLTRLGMTKLADVRNGYFASPGYIAANGMPDEPDDLRAHRCIGYSFQTSTDAWDNDRWIVYREATVRAVGVSLAMTTNSGLVMKNLVIEGHGVAVLPEQRAADAVANGQLVRVLPAYHPETLTLSAVYPVELAASPKVAHLLHELKAGFA
jgi:DNA-binding transcriptional LysR family regulator